MEQNKKLILAGGISLLLAMGLFFGLPKLYESGKEQVLESRADESIASVYASLSPQAQKLYIKQSEQLTKPVPERLVELDELKIGCFGPQNIMHMSAADVNLGGQCCGVLTDIEAYEVQLQALETFIEENGNIDIIPRDPYDMSVEQAQLLTSFDQISLTAEQQGIYDKAMKMSHHGGPCCCKCWKWYVMSGLAKKLIVDYGWDEHQVAELWDTSSSCGHKEDTNMHQHYDVEDEEHTASH